MLFTRRPFAREQDKSLMSALARQHPQENLHVIDLPYRLSSWALDIPENVGLWFDENLRLVAWAVLQTPFWTIYIVCHPDVEQDLYPKILAWAKERAFTIRSTPNGLPVWYVNVFPDQTGRISALEQTGFSYQSEAGGDSWSKVLMQCTSPSSMKTYSPPPGFSVRPLNGKTDLDRYVELHRAVFETKNMTVEWRQRTLEHPIYLPDLDLVATTPDGRLAAFCVCWFDKELKAGHVEPLGCHKDFRRYALGRVVLSEGLSRLFKMGAEEVFVETDNFRNTAFRLYESFTFRVKKDVFMFGKGYGDLEAI